jgi:molybdopterin biosynthesis enzyme MoaB
VQVVISSGGTGLTGRDGTPEAVAPLLDKTIEGFGELFRVLSFDTIGTSSLQSRCLAGVANGTVIFVLPGLARCGGDRLGPLDRGASWMLRRAPATWCSCCRDSRSPR